MVVRLKMATLLPALWIIVVMSSAESGITLTDSVLTVTMASQVAERDVGSMVMKVIENYLHNCHLVAVTSNTDSIVFIDIIR